LSQPINDNCTDAIPLIPNTDTTITTGTTVAATVGPYFGNCPPNTDIAPTVFYSFAGTGSKVKISTCSASTDFATAITVTNSCSDSCSLASDGDLECTTNADAAAVTFDTVAAQSYTLIVYGRQPGLEGNFGISALEYTPPVNNNLENSIAFLPGLTENTVITGSTVNATVGPYFGNCPPNTDIAPTVFYSFEGTGSKVKISTCSASTDFATAITVGPGSCLFASDGDPECTTNANAAAITFDTVAAQIYTLIVYGRQPGLEGNFQLSLIDLDNTAPPTPTDVIDTVPPTSVNDVDTMPLLTSAAPTVATPGPVTPPRPSPVSSVPAPSEATYRSWWWSAVLTVIVTRTLA
jgi:hypothetical protein